MGAQTTSIQAAPPRLRGLTIAAIPAAITLAFLGWLIGSGNWKIFGIWTLESTTGRATGFGDLAFITATASCFSTENAGGAIDLDTCDPYGRPYTPYGLIPGKILAFFGLGFEQTWILGITLMVIWVLSVFWLTYTLTKNWRRGNTELAVAIALITLLAISPTAMLAVERGTLDIVVVALAMFGLLGFTTSGKFSPARKWFSSFALFTAVALKYFPLGLFAPFFAPKRWSVPASIGAAVTALFLLLNLDNLRSATQIAMADSLSTTRIMFSSTTGLVTWLVEDPLAFNPPPDQILNETTLQTVGALLFAALTIGLVALLRSVSKKELSMPPTTPNLPWYLIVGGSFSLSIPYFLGASNDYRLILLLLPLTGLLIWIGTTRKSALRLTLWIVATATTIAALTGASMIPNDSGFIVPKAILVFGDACLALTLAFGAALFINAWITQASIKRRVHE